MPVATINGGSGSDVVNAIPFTSQQALLQGQSVLNTLSNLLSNGYTNVNINAGAPASGLLIGSVDGSRNVNLGALTNNIQALMVSNTGTTTASNSRFIGNASVVAGQGGLTFTDNGGSTSIAVGGGTNAVTFSSNSTNAYFIGDGINTLTVATASGTTSVYGTNASTDTITGSGNIVYTSSASASAFINPGAANVTVFGAGGGGSETVFGGASTNTFSGMLTVTDGTGYFQGGTAGNNTMGSSSIGSTTLIGGGNGDVLSAKGVKDVLVAGGGSSTLDGSHSTGGDSFWASSTGSSLMYGGDSQGDTFYINNSTAQGVGFTGSFIDLHTGPNSQLRGLNSNVASTVNVGFANAGANYATVGDFVTGLDKLVLNTAITGANYTLSNGTMGNGTTQIAYSTLQTSNGSLVTFYNATITNNDIVKV